MLALAVLAYWGVLYAAQRRMMYQPPRTTGAPALPADARVHWLETAAGRTETWFLPPRRVAGPPAPAPLLIFAHGNAELIDDWADAFEPARQRGIGVLLVEYPGYGRSGGSPSRTAIGTAFAAAYDWAAVQPEVDAARIVGHGRSLGGGVIGDLATARPLAALILESTFTRVTDFALGFLAPPVLAKDRYDNVAAVTAFPGPELVLHGDDDRIIPVRHGERLARAAGVALVRMPCGHNDCPRPWDAIESFLRAAGVIGGHLPPETPTVARP